MNTYTLPSANLYNCVMEILAAAENDIFELPLRKATVSHSSSYQVEYSTSNANTFRVTYSSDSHAEQPDVSVIIPDIRLISGLKAVYLRKLFLFVLSKVNQSALSDNGVIAAASVSFPLSELADIGLYRYSSSARRGFLHSINILKTFSLFDKSDDVSFIKDGFIKKGICYVSLFPNKFIRPAFMTLPCCYFALPSRDSDLLYYICYLARQNRKPIELTGNFSVSIRAVIERLCMSHSTRYLNRWVRSPLANMLHRINDAANGYLHVALPPDYFIGGINLLMKKRLLIQYNRS